MDLRDKWEPHGFRVVALAQVRVQKWLNSNLVFNSNKFSSHIKLESQDSLLVTGIMRGAIPLRCHLNFELVFCCTLQKTKHPTVLGLKSLNFCPECKRYQHWEEGWMGDSAAKIWHSETSLITQAILQQDKIISKTMNITERRQNKNKKLRTMQLYLSYWQSWKRYSY